MKVVHGTLGSRGRKQRETQGDSKTRLSDRPEQADKGGEFKTHGDYLIARETASRGRGVAPSRGQGPVDGAS